MSSAIRCIGCGGAYVEMLTIERFRDDECEVSKCRSCGLAFTSRRSRDYNQEYDRDPNQFAEKYYAVLNGLELHDRHPNYLEIAAIVGRLGQRGRVLDVGCNAGWLLGYLRPYDGLELFGLEPSASLARVARERVGVDVRQARLEDDVFAPGFFHVVTLTDVFEHMPDPNRALTSLNRLLRSEGYVLIKVPNERFTRIKHRLAGIALSRRLLHSRDVWDAKEHAAHYSVSTLCSLLSKHGFEVSEIRAPRPVQTRGSRRLVKAGRWCWYRLARIGLVPSADILVVASKTDNVGAAARIEEAGLAS